MEAPTRLIPEGIPNPHQLLDALDASGVHNASGTHNTQPVEAIERAHP